LKTLSKKKYIKIGLLGGTFDPPHIGHIQISKIGIKRFKLKKLLWLITKKNPFKNKAYFSLNNRLKLSKLLTKNEYKITVGHLEKKIKSNKVFYLLRYLKKKNPNTKFYFFMGSDNLIKFHKWYKWRKIPLLAKMVIFARPGYELNFNKYIKKKKLDKNNWIYINAKKVNISSSLIKKFW